MVFIPNKGKEVAMDKKAWLKVLYYGGIWGIAEATLGYALHAHPMFTTLKIAGSIMFPIGVWCMYQAFRKTDRIQAAMLVSFIAAAIKSVNFLMPFTNTINPIMAILLEGLTVYLVMPLMLDKSSRFMRLAGMGLAMSAIWRAPFVFLPYQFGWLGIWQKSAEQWVPFLTTDVFISGLFIAVFISLALKLPQGKRFAHLHERFAYTPVSVMTLLTTALALEYFIR